MIRKSAKFSALVFLSALPLSVQAQDSPTQGPPAPTGRFDAITTGFTAGIDISEDDAKTSADIGGVLIRRRDDGAGNQGQDVLRWKVGVEYPFGGQSNLLDADLEALGDQASLSASLTWKSFSSSLEGIDHPRFRAHIEAAVDACKQRNSDLAEAARVNCERLRDEPASAVVQEYLPAVFSQLRSSLYSAFWTLGIEGSIGADDFKYVQSGTLSEFEDRELSYSVALTGVYYPADTVSAWKLQAEYAHAYAAADEIPVCRTVVVVPAEDCVNASPTAPTREETLVGRFEYRRFFPFAGSTRGVGIAPMVSADMLSGDRGVEFPIFLALGSDSIVLPGVKLGYAKDGSKPANADEEITFALFLKTSFGL